MKKLSCLLPALLASSLSLHAQSKSTLNGYIKDRANGEALIGAAVSVKSLQTGTVANVYGFYSLTVPSGTYEVEFTYIGFVTQIRTVELNQTIRLDVELESSTQQLEEVVVTDEEEKKPVRTEMSANELTVNTIKKIPAFLGEVDVVKSLQMLPGVSTVGEGASGFNVRGGSVGQNLVLLDEAPVYNSSHMLGFFSVFNPDAVRDVKLYKGAIPPKYGGRISSILDVRMKEGNNKKMEYTGGIGTIFTRLSVEGPLIKEKASFIVAARRSYIDVLARPFVKALQNGAGLNFYDLTAKANYNISRRDRVYVSGYFGRDNFLFDRNQGFSWGSATGSTRWNHIFNQRLFGNLTGLYSTYDYHLKFGKTERDKFSWNSSISNYIVKPELTYFINSHNELSFGAEAIYYTFTPADATSVSNGESQDISLARKYNFEGSVYAGNTQHVGESLTFEYGLRFSSFNYFGPGSAFIYRDTVPGIRKPIDHEVTYAKGTSISHYQNFEPRASFKAQLNKSSFVKGSYNRMAQYLHLISSTTASNPLDVWNPSTNNILPELADQFTLGFFRSFERKQNYEFSVEAYFRSTQHQIDYINGADLLLNKYLEGDILSGQGRAYGMEFFAQKTTGKFNGWVSYTLGWSQLKVDGINNNEWYYTRYDQRHNIKVAAFYDISNRLSASANLVVVSGTPTTFPTSRYVVQGLLIPYNANDSRNNVRIPTYHRLDVSLRLEGKRQRKNGTERKNHDYWVFSIYNVYARHNPFSIYFSQVEKGVIAGQPIPSQATQLSIIGSFVPAVSYNFKF